MKRRNFDLRLSASVLLLTLLAFATTSAQAQNNNTIVGMWTGMWSSTQAGPNSC